MEYGSSSAGKYGTNPEPGAVGVPPVPGAASPRSRRLNWRAELPLMLTLIVAGVALAFVWRGLTPHTAALGDEQEAAASVDGTLALLGILLGALTAAFVLIRPGSAPVTRTVVAIIGSLAGGALSWVLGDQLGTPALRATGAAFTWPVATALVLFLGALLPGTSARLEARRRP